MLSTLARPRTQASVTWSPVDDRWYREIGGMRADSGAVIVPEAALSVAVVFRAVNVLAHSVASVPLVVYGRLDDDGKEKARGHVAYDLLHDKPNAWMTSFRWRHLLMTQAVLWGNHYSEIIPGLGGIGALVPLSPDTTRIVDQFNDGRLLYVTRDVKLNGFGEERRVLQDDMLHIRGFSIDGKSGLPLTRVARNAIGLALSAERHGSMFLKKGARLAGILTSAVPMKEEIRKKNEDVWQSQFGGAAGSGSTPVLSGLDYKQISPNQKDSQWLESRQFQAEEILRFLGVPGVLVGMEDQKTFASAEQFFLSFVTHTIRPWTENISQDLNMSVVTEGPRFFADFVLEGLLRGDIKTRYDAHRIAISSGWKTRNEARVEENYNRGPDDLDEFLEPLNMVEAGSERAEAAEASARTARHPQLATIARRSVERLVRKEVVAVMGDGKKKGGAARYADDPAGWERWLVKFYDAHAVLVSEELGVPLADARAYCAVQRTRFDSLGDLGDSIEDDSVSALMELTPDLGEWQ